MLVQYAARSPTGRVATKLVVMPLAVLLVKAWVTVTVLPCQPSHPGQVSGRRSPPVTGPTPPGGVTVTWREASVTAPQLSVARIKRVCVSTGAALERVTVPFVWASGLDGSDEPARGEIVAGMEEDTLTGLEAGSDDGVAFSAIAEGETPLCQGRVISDDIAGPVLLPPEEGAQGDEEGAGSLAEDDPGLDAVGVPETGGASALLREEIGDDIDALLLDAKRGDSGEGGGFEKADSCVEGLVAAPAIDDHPGTRIDLHRIGREDLDDQFEVGRIADLKEGRASREDALAHLVQRQDAPGDRRTERQARLFAQAKTAHHRKQGSPGDIDLGGSGERAGTGGGQVLGGDGLAVAPFIEGLAREIPGGDEPCGPLPLPCGQGQRTLLLLDPGGRFPRGGLGGPQACRCRALLARIEGIEGQGGDLPDHLASGNPIPLADTETAKEPADWRRDDVAVPDPGTTFGSDRHREGSLGDGRYLDRDRLWSQRQDCPTNQRRRHRHPGDPSHDPSSIHPPLASSLILYPAPRGYSRVLRTSIRLS